MGICHTVEKQDEGMVCLSFQARQKCVFIQGDRRFDHSDYSLVIVTPCSLIQYPALALLHRHTEIVSKLAHPFLPTVFTPLLQLQAVAPEAW